MKKFLFVTAFTLAMGGTGMAQNVNPFLQKKYLLIIIGKLS